VRYLCWGTTEGSRGKNLVPYPPSFGSKCGAQTDPSVVSRRGTICPGRGGGGQVRGEETKLLILYTKKCEIAIATVSNISRGKKAGGTTDMDNKRAHRSSTAFAGALYTQGGGDFGWFYARWVGKFTHDEKGGEPKKIPVGDRNRSNQAMD